MKYIYINLFSDNCGYKLFFLIFLLYTSNPNTFILSQIHFKCVLRLDMYFSVT